MSLFLSGRSVAERALRKIGAYAIADTGADAEEMRETLYWLDFVVAELAGSTKLFHLEQTDTTIALTADTTSYNLENSVASGPADGIMFVTRVQLRDSGGNDVPLKMLSRTEYDEISDKDKSGTPCAVYIDRLDDMTVYLIGVPTATGYSLVVTTLAYPPDMTTRLGANSVGFSAEWNKFLVTATAAEIGDGPVRRLSSVEIGNFRNEARLSKTEIKGYANREQRGTRPRRTAPWGM